MNTDLLVPGRRRSSTRSWPARSPRPEALYAPAREPYEAIEPVAETFGDLDPEIDARENDVPAGGTFDRIPPHREGTLGRTTRRPGMATIAKKLLTDVTTSCRRLVKTVDLDPATIANGAVGLLNECLVLEDHRRGGPLLAYRPVRLRGQRRRFAGRLQRRSARSSWPIRRARLDDRPALRRGPGRPQAVPEGRRLCRLHDADAGRHPER